MNKTYGLIEEAVELIERDLKEPLCLDRLSRELFVSKYHLNRLFSALTLQPLMGYVRSRRLSRSIHNLLYTDSRIMDIALEYGFSYEQSYERAFKKEFGVSPTAFRCSPCELKVVPRFDIHDAMVLENGIIIRPRFIFLPQLMVAGVRHLIDIADEKNSLQANQCALLFNREQKKRIRNRIKEDIYYGITFSTNNAHEFEYMPCVQIADPASVEPPFEALTFPTRYYAVFRYVGLHSADELSALQLDKIYGYINEEWYRQVEYQRTEDYYIERIDLGICASDYCEADIFAPISGN